MAGGWFAEPATLLRPSVVGSALAVGLLAGICELARRAALLAFVAGVLTGIALSFGGLIALFFAFTKPGKLGTKLQARPTPPAPPLAPGARPAADGDSPHPPHGVADRGWFAGVVYLVPCSRWERDATLEKWPPTGERERELTRWHAELDQGTLVLTQDVASGPQSGPGSGGGGLLSPPTKLGIPLEGCRVELVADGLQGRSHFLRRGPLLISHEHWALFAGEKGFYMFAGDPASKQAWLHALQWWCQGGDRLQRADARYRDYCEHMARRSLVPFAVLRPTAPRAAAATAGDEPGGRARSGGAGTWRRLGAVTVAAFRTRRGEGRRPGDESASAPEEESLERFWDRKWMQPGKVSMSASTRAAVAAATGSKGKGAAGNGQAGSNAATPRAGDVIEVPMRPVPSAAQQTSPGGAQGDEEEAVAPGAQADATATTGASDEQFSTPAGSPERAPRPGTHTSPHGPPHPLDDDASLDRSSFQSHGPPPSPHPADMEQAINMFLVRFGYDALRGGWWRDWLFRRIQRQLSRLQVADVVKEVRLVEVQPGCAVPTVGRAHTLPCPTPGALWPQLEFDVCYRGDFSIVLETSIDIRDGKAWGRLDRTLAKWGAPRRRRKAEEKNDSDSGSGSDDDSDDGAPATSNASSTSSQSPPGTPARASSGLGLRRSAAKKLRSLAESTASSIQNVPLQLRLSFTRLDGRMVLWMSPPPGNRLFYAFLAPPKMHVEAKPRLGNRLLKYSAQIARVSSMIEQRILSSFKKNTVFPGGGDIALPGMISLDHDELDAPFTELARDSDKQAEN